MKKHDENSRRAAKTQTQYESHRLTLPSARRRSDRLIQRTVWFVPLIVLMVCFGLLYEHLVKVGPVIEIEFDEGAAVTDIEAIPLEDNVQASAAIHAEEPAPSSPAPKSSSKPAAAKPAAAKEKKEDDAVAQFLMDLDLDDE